jgi:DNA-directed RNA polymerase specialized sigma24 family protein
MTIEERRSAAYYALCRSAARPPVAGFVAYAQQAARRQIIQDWQWGRRMRGYPTSYRPVIYSGTPPAGTAIVRSTPNVTDDVDELEAVVARIDQLDPTERAVVRGAMRGLRIREIAKVIGKRESVANAILSRARMALSADEAR